jgi:hypothetical protein
MSDTNYISAKKANRLTSGYQHKLNFTMWQIVDSTGENTDLRPGAWMLIFNYFTPTVFLKVEDDMTLTEYYVKED